MTSPRPRNTRQRQLVWSLMKSADEFLTAQQVHEQLRSGGQSIGLATVYRTLQSLSESEQLDTIYTPEGEVAYRRCSDGHHHHLICRTCGRVEEVSGDELELWSRSVAAEHGFTQPEHYVEIYGRCPECSS